MIPWVVLAHVSGLHVLKLAVCSESMHEVMGSYTHSQE